jgi:hypothetical protein
MVLDASDPRGILGGDAQCSALILRSDYTPEMDYPARDDDVVFTGTRPFLVPQFGNQQAADRPILLFVFGSGSAAG